MAAKAGGALHFNYELQVWISDTGIVMGCGHQQSFYGPLRAPICCNARKYAGYSEAQALDMAMDAR